MLPIINPLHPTPIRRWINLIGVNVRHPSRRWRAWAGLVLPTLADPPLALTAALWFPLMPPLLLLICSTSDIPFTPASRHFLCDGGWCRRRRHHPPSHKKCREAGVKGISEVLQINRSRGGINGNQRAAVRANGGSASVGRTSPAHARQRREGCLTLTPIRLIHLRIGVG